MTPEIIDRDEFIVVGIRTVMEMGAQNTGTLWKDEFLPRHGELKNADHSYYGVYNTLPDDRKNDRFEYVAGVVGSLEDIPVGMVGWVVPEGHYAQIEAKGMAAIGQACRELMTNWLPDSGYSKVAGPLFAVTEDGHPDSPDAVWKINIPVETPEEIAAMEKWKV